MPHTTTFAPKKLQATLRHMHRELKRNRLEIQLVKAPEPKHPGHMIRVAAEKNPWWYQELCAGYPSGRSGNDVRRKKRTKIKRGDTLITLKQLSTVGFSRSHYAKDLIDLAIEYEERLKNGLC